MKAKSTIGNTIIYIILVLMSIIWLIPFVCIVFESFRGESTGQVGYLIPKQWSWANYKALFVEDPDKTVQFLLWYKNTFIIAAVSSVIHTFIVLCTSYTLSRMRFRGRKALMNIMLVLGMFPGFITMIVLYTILSKIGWTGAGSVPGLILIYTASAAMGYYVSKGFFDTVPRSLDEAARIDGATRAQVLFKITLPMAKPIVIYQILTAFMAPWGDFIFAKYIAHGTSAGMTVAVGMQNLITKSNNSAHYTHFCAAGVVVAIPITILFMFLQKYYVEGVTGGAVKG
ncbi:MAG: sugar ABC transporter permease [Lachnospiraceae bacterium]|nr:sugar ABC transporter permease [Lachnospiraceae bacterium]